MRNWSEALPRYRGHPLKLIEWGLYNVTDVPGLYMLYYRPAGWKGPSVRRWSRLPLPELRQHVRQVRAEIERRKLHLPRPVTATEALNEYVETLQALNRSDKHISDLTAGLSRFLEKARPRSLADITVREIQQFLNTLTTSPRTRVKYRAWLSAWLNWAIRTGYLDHNPIVQVERPKLTRKLKPFPTPADMLSLADRAANSYDMACFTFLLMTGIRRGSFLALSPDCFTPDGIHIRSTKEGAEWFLSYAAGCPLWWPELSQLGIRIWAERAPTPALLRTHLDAATDGAFTIHAFRHAFCSWLAMMGENMSDIAAWAHHSSPTVTEQWYAHLRPHGIKRAGENRKTVRQTLRGLCASAAHNCSASPAGPVAQRSEQRTHNPGERGDS